MCRTLLKTSLAAFIAASLLTLPQATDAAILGGRMIYARYTDSQFLDPVLNDVNTDTWVLTSPNDT